MNYGYLSTSNKSGVTDANAPTVAQGPIVLPPPEEQQSPSDQWVRPADMGRMWQSSLPANPRARTSRSSKKDPAYRVLFVAITVVILSIIACFALVTGAFNGLASQIVQGGQTNPQNSPNGGIINNNTPTPIAMPTTSPTTTQPPVTAPLTVQITSGIPNPTQNNRTIRVKVTTNQADVSVHLQVVYDVVQPLTTQPQNVGNQNIATIPWNVQVKPPRRGMTVNAQVTAIAQDQQGHQVTSQPVIVQITTNNRG